MGRSAHLGLAKVVTTVVGDSATTAYLVPVSGLRAAAATMPSSIRRAKRPSRSATIAHFARDHGQSAGPPWLANAGDGVATGGL